jgi:ubiquitin-like 1-activating enzyme E1 B
MEDTEVRTHTNLKIADEIQKLREEALALKEIRESMGSDDFCRKVFEKVFKVDIERLRGMEDMWKERQPPDALEYDSIEQDPSLSSPATSKEDRREWTLKENFVVFKDR